MTEEIATVKLTMSNTSDYTRRWDSLQRLEDRTDKEGNVIAVAGSTLELEPGESAAVEVPQDFEDPWLKEAKVGAPKKGASKETSTTETKKEG